MSSSPVRTSSHTTGPAQIIPLPKGEHAVSDHVADLDALISMEVPTGPIAVLAHSTGTAIVSHWLLTSSAVLQRVTHVSFLGARSTLPFLPRSRRCEITMPRLSPLAAQPQWQTRCSSSTKEPSQAKPNVVPERTEVTSAPGPAPAPENDKTESSIEDEVSEVGWGRPRWRHARSRLGCSARLRLGGLRRGAQLRFARSVRTRRQRAGRSTGL